MAASSFSLPIHILLPRRNVLQSAAMAPQRRDHRPKFSKPLMASISATALPAFDLKSYWSSLISEIDDRLETAVPLRYPDRIHEAMRYSVLARGKRASPVMCIAACELVGGRRTYAFPTACALEMIHAASLIHDDLPYMDDDLQRRGRPSSHAVFGLNMSLLAGDALFPLGFEHIVSRTPTEVAPECVLAVVAEIARMVGSTGMVAGQLIDLRLANDAGQIGQAVQAEDLAVFIKEKKFGEMAECSAVCGAILGGAAREEVEKLRRYGRAVGVLYELVQDMKACVKEGEEKGKEKKWNYVRFYGLQRAKELVQKLRDDAKSELSGFHGEEVAPLHSFVDYAIDTSFQPNIK